MEDSKIIDMYWQRDERAIEETDRQYGGYLLKIAVNILADREDGRESVNDTYLKAWESMPPPQAGGAAALSGQDHPADSDRYLPQENKAEAGRIPIRRIPFRTFRVYFRRRPYPGGCGQQTAGGGHRGMAERSDATAEGSIFKQILLYGSDQRYRRILRIQSVQGQEHAHAPEG